MTTASLIRRNINLFFRDKASVFFSLLSVVIIIVLYAAFLGNIQVQNIQETAGKVEGAAWLVNSWILAGILSVSSVTIAFSAFGTMVDDIHGGQDFIQERHMIIEDSVTHAWNKNIFVAQHSGLLPDRGGDRFI